jgi:predicted house-cleaning noncanonical NTP pyrophosphatase (MazG superfamily)
MDKRKEFTQSLVSNLKSKISEFKNKKTKTELKERMNLILKLIKT